MSRDRAALDRRLRGLTAGPASPADGAAGAWIPAAAMRQAAAGYARTHPDDESRHAADDRRFRWSVPWRVAGTAALAVALLVGAVVLRSMALTPGAAVDLPDPAPPGGAASGSVQTPEPSASGGVVVVHVVGAVAAPGVVRLPSGARVIDALEAAGGAAPDADLARVNLARVLVDGEQVVVPRPGDPPSGGQVADDGTLDLNTASLAELDGLPGVGPVLAQRIVDRRPYTSVDELDEVSGIGQTVLERLRPLVHV